MEGNPFIITDINGDVNVIENCHEDVIQDQTIPRTSALSPDGNKPRNINTLRQLVETCRLESANMKVWCFTKYLNSFLANGVFFQVFDQLQGLDTFQKAHLAYVLTSINLARPEDSFCSSDELFTDQDLEAILDIVQHVGFTDLSLLMEHDFAP